jgi:hypothetical protein
LVAILAALAAAYWPVLHGYYLHTDDYFWSRWGGFPPAAVVSFLSIAGRPLTGLIYCAYHLIPTIQAWNLLRALNVVNLAVLGWMVYRCLARQVPSLAALAIAVALLTTPPFATTAAYASTAPFALSATLATLAYLAMGREGWRYATLAFVLLILSLSLYQPGALFYLALVAVWIFLSDAGTRYREYVRKLLPHAAVLGCACGVYYAGWRISLDRARIPLSGKYDARQFTGNLQARLDWFVHTPLVEASNLWLLRPVVRVSLMVGLVVLAALCLECAGGAHRIRGVAGKAAALVAIIPLTWGINLASYMPSPEYRTYLALESAIGLLFLLALYRILSAPRWMAPNGAACVLAAIAVGGVYAAHVSVQRYFTTPDSTEFRFVKSCIARYQRAHGADYDEINVVVVRRPVAPVQRNEIGEPSLRHGPNLRPIVTAALRELGIWRDVPVFQTLPDQRSLWFEFGTRLHWLPVDYSYGPPRAGKVLTIDASDLGSGTYYVPGN